MNIKNKSQVTNFVILGIIGILAVVGISYFLSNNLNKGTDSVGAISTQQYMSAQQTVLDNFIEECVKRTTIAAETNLGISESLSPPLIKEYLVDNLPACFDEFQKFKDSGYKVTTGDMAVSVTITDDVMLVVVNYPVVAEKANSRFAFNYRKYDFPRTVMEKLNTDKPTTIVSADGSTVLTIPAGTKATLNGAPVNKIGFKVLDKNFDGLKNSVLAGMLAFQGLPEGTVFDRPVTITKYYNSYDIPVIQSIQDLAIGYYNKELDLWIGIPTQVDESKQELNAEVMHFTPYAVVTSCKNMGGTLDLPNLLKNPWSPDGSEWNMGSYWMAQDPKLKQFIESNQLGCSSPGASGTMHFDTSIITPFPVSGNGNAVQLKSADDLTPYDPIYSTWYPLTCTKEDYMSPNCDNLCPATPLGTCTDNTPLPNDNNANNLPSSSCTVKLNYFPLNDGSRRDIPFGQTVQSVSFQGSGQSCIFESKNTEKKFDANGYTGDPSTGTDTTSSVIKGDSNINTVTTSIKDCSPSDTCKIGASKLTLDSSKNPTLQFELEVLNGANSPETLVNAGATISFSGVGVEAFKYSCDQTQAKSTTLKMINGANGPQCYRCVSQKIKDPAATGGTSTVYVWGNLNTNNQPLTPSDCFGQNICATNFDNKCEIIIGANNKPQCNICNNGVATTADMSKCAKCQAYEAATNLITNKVVYSVTGHQTQNVDPSLPDCVDCNTNTCPSPKYQCNPSGQCVPAIGTGVGPGTGGEGSTCTGDQDCKSPMICHGGKCTNTGGGGGGGGKKCDGGDSEVTRYPSCPDDFSTKYMSKKFKINSGQVLNSRSIKFCDSGKDFSSTTTEFLIFGSAMRQGVCYFLVEPNDDPSQDYYVFKTEVDTRTTIYGGQEVCKAPAIPANFASNTKTNDSISLKWGSVPEAEKYLVFMDGINIANATNETYNVTGLLNSTYYRFNVTSYNSTFCMNMSNATATLNISTLNNTVVIAPAQTLIRSFTKESDTYTSVFLVWVVNGAFNYSNLTRNGTIVYSGNATNFTDSGLENRSGYYYQLNVTRNNVTESMNATFYPKEESLRISNFSVEKKAATSITMNWTTIGVYMRSDLYMDYNLVYSGTEKNYTITGLNPDTAYFFELRVIGSTSLVNSTNKTVTTNP